MILRNCCSATSMPAAVQRLRMSPSRQRFTLRWVWRTISIIDSIGLVEHERLGEAARRSRARISVSVSSIPSRSEPAASGQERSSSPASSSRRWRARSGSRQRPGGRASGRGRPVAVCLGQQVGDVSLLVAVAAMHQGVLAEDLADRLGERLGAVDHEEDRLLGVQAAVDQVGQQRAREGGVLGRALPEPERDLDALGGDPERDHVRALGDLQAVEHHRRQAHVLETAASSAPPAPCVVRSTNASETEELRGSRGRRLLDILADRLARRRRSGGWRPRRASGPSPLWSADRGRRSARRCRAPARARRRPSASAGRLTLTRRPPRVIDPSS